MRGRRAIVATMLAAMITPVISWSPVRAQSSSAATPTTGSSSASVDPQTAEARDAFARGVELVDQARWSEALASFERSFELRPHALTRYNVGACERALGRYTRARRALIEALARNTARDSKEMAPSYVEEAKTYLSEIDKLLVHVDTTVAPTDAAVAVDGRPLAAIDGDAPPVRVGGLEPPGPGRPPGAARFELQLDPGAHVITITRKGFSDVVVNRTWAPGAHAKLDLVLDKLPAVLRIRADREGAVVTVNDVDVGLAPVELSRPAGTYRVVVKKPGFVTYRAQVDARAGEELNLRATLDQETTPITGRWWFWTLAGVVVAGAAVGTYALTRPEKSPPPPDGGGLGVVFNVP